MEIFNVGEVVLLQNTNVFQMDGQECTIVGALEMRQTNVWNNMTGTTTQQSAVCYLVDVKFLNLQFAPLAYQVRRKDPPGDIFYDSLGDDSPNTKIEWKDCIFQPAPGHVRKDTFQVFRR